MPILWPAIVSLKDIDELLFVGSQQQWESEADFKPVRFQPGDQLIDAAGSVFSLGENELVESDAVTLDQVLDLVRQHASVCGQCCVSKMGAPSITDAIRMVEHIE